MAQGDIVTDRSGADTDRRTGPQNGRKGSPLINHVYFYFGRLGLPGEHRGPGCIMGRRQCDALGDVLLENLGC